MAKFNGAGVKTSSKGFTGTLDEAVINHQGGTGFLRDEKSELFISTVSSFLGDDFYESSQDRESRIGALAAKVAVNDPEWITQFVEWLRGSGNIRSAALVVALEAADAMVQSKVPGGRNVVSAALQRADEPGEALAYWHSRKGRKIPSAVKRGIADAIGRLYSEYSVAKYNSGNSSVSLKDAIAITHPKPVDDHQSVLFQYINEREFDSRTPVPDELVQLKNRQNVLSLPDDEMLNLVSSEEGSKILKEAGLTWEAVAGKIGLSKKIWTNLIPSMGYMALLRNLRNFIQNGVPLENVLKIISNEDVVAKSRQLPFRFYSAYTQVKSNLEVSAALEKALNASLSNIPALDGKTLIMVDCSGSMSWSYGSGNSQITNMEKAAVFGSALALRAENANLYGYGTSYKKINFSKGDSILPVVNKFGDMGGTNTTKVLKDLTRNTKYDRVVIITDEQYGDYYGNPSDVLSKDIPLYTWSLVGYKVGHKVERNRHTFGGLTDQSFRLIPLLEKGYDADWPWAK